MRLSQSLIHSFDDLSGYGPWLPSVPVHLGRQRALDIAVEALIKLREFRLHQISSEASASTRLYMQAVSSLRTELDTSDSTLLTIALLTIYEATTSGFAFPTLGMHSRGMGAVLLARAEWKSSLTTEVTRYVVYTNVTFIFLIPTVLR